MLREANERPFNVPVDEELYHVLANEAAKTGISLCAIETQKLGKTIDPMHIEQEYNAMSKEKTHDLHDFMRQLGQEMAAEYNRIQKRALEDPGTAGDQGEENWAELLRGWLPRTYEVVTKGRIISADGRTSPQIDVLVLKDVYPENLLNKKLYLAAGVAAAFECKITLRASHIEDAVKNCVAIKNLYPVREGTPYKELHAPIVYGLLAHSHSWKHRNSTPERNVLQKLRQSDMCFVSHPRLGLDMLCVADLESWILSKMTFFRANPGNESVMPKQCRPDGRADSGYLEHTPFLVNQKERFTPIGTLIAKLTEMLAWEEPTLRDIVDYYRATKIGGSGAARLRPWPISIYSESVQQQIKGGRRLIPLVESWDEWKSSFGL